jgi:hypothetical protein
MFRNDLTRRMAYAFRRASRAMAVTSSTTSVAFLANMASPMLPIRAFGVFAGVIIPVNYVLVVLVFPPAAILYDRYIYGCWTNICCLIFCCRKRKVEVVELTEQKFTCSERFFRYHWNSFVNKCRWVIVAATLIWFLFACSKAVQLGP